MLLSTIKMNPFAIYFPQFYPTATNDKAWGSGFTDWALVANANMKDSWQRRAPMAGYYDGSSSYVHSRQMQEVKSAGLEGFAIYHYWFYTHQELNAFERTLLSSQASDSIELPWFLIWATESWSKRWLANPDVLIHLTTTPTYHEIETHCDHLAICFSHPTYTQWHNKPLFVFYNLAHFSEPESVVVRYREAMLRRGFDMAVAHFIKNPFDLSFCSFTDASYLFEPRLFFSSKKFMRNGVAKYALNVTRKFFSASVIESFHIVMDRLQKSGVTYSVDSFLTYMNSPERKSWLTALGHPWQDVLSPGWNNTPRYGDRFTALASLDASTFEGLVSKTLRNGDLPPLINAWNEWTEGAAIEPCAYLGQNYLDAITSAVRNHASVRVN
jgi:Glycosyltransferase WbsX